MIFNGSTIKSYAKQALSRNYWTMVLFCFVFFAVSIALASLAAIPIVGWAVTIIAIPVVTVSFNLQMYWTYHSGDAPEISHLFEGFKSHRIGHIVGGYWYMELFIFLWTLVFIIPGIIKSIAYSMTPYILMDQPEIHATDALAKSMQMTKGYKMDIFLFNLSFIGWFILSLFTCGLLELFYVGPYYSLAMAGIYDFLKANDEA